MARTETANSSGKRSLYYEDLHTGYFLETTPVQVTENDIQEFARLTRDQNPLHVSPAYAASTPFGRPVAHGLLGTSLVLGLLHEAGIFEDTGLALLGLDRWRFTAPIFPGDYLRVRMTITGRRVSTSASDRGVVHRQLTLLNQTDVIVQAGDSPMLVKRRSQSMDPVNGPVSTRITPLSELSQEQEAALGGALRAPNESPLNLFRVLAHHPKLLKRFNLLGNHFLSSGVLPARDRELAILRTAWLCGSDYESLHHSTIAQDVGCSDEEIAATSRDDVEGLGEAEARLVLAVDELVQTGDLNSETWTLLSRRYDTPQMIELLLLVGFYRMLATTIKALRVPLDGEPTSFRD